MAETRSRSESNLPRPRTRTRTRPDVPPSNGDEEMHPPAQASYSEEATATQTVEAPPHDELGEEGGFDEETNSRYEEIKRGSTHISELQSMTMPQLLKVAK